MAFDVVVDEAFLTTNEVVLVLMIVVLDSHRLLLLSFEAGSKPIASVFLCFSE